MVVGKTTLLNIIGGLDRYTSGDLVINGKSTKNFKDRDWDAYRNYKIGFVFQSYNLISHQTVLSNVELALTIGGISKKERLQRAEKALEEVGLKDQMHKKPNQLSGGQMQRVAIARALVNNPDIILADEPTGALDTKTSIQVMEILKKISKDKLIIMVTHNPELAEKYSSRIIRILDGIITEDSNPILENEKIDAKEEANTKIGRTSMRFWTAFRLSLNNLLTKKGRTILVAFAGSIGIIGIALVQAVSNGFQNYVDTIQEDTLSSYPFSIYSETTDITGTLLSLASQNGKKDGTDIVKEQQYMSTMLSNLNSNDLRSFNNYLKDNYDDIKNDITSIKYTYSVEPTVYALDAANNISKLSPVSLFNMPYSTNMMKSLTSTYSQMLDDTDSLNASYDVLAGRWPKEYNEMVVVLSEPNAISDYLVYSLGLRDTAELSKVVTKIMNGETAKLDNEPLELTYSDLLNVKLKLIMPSDLYVYNEKYNTYEDMSGDKEYMEKIYNNAEDLKIVGIISAKEGVTSLALTPGISYRSELIDHIINYSKEQDVVKKQLENDEVDVFSGKRFDDKTNSLKLDFKDLVSVDTAMLKSAFSVNIDNSVLEKQLSSFTSDISKQIIEDAKKVKNDFKANFKTYLKEFAENIKDKLTAENVEEIKKEIDDFIKNFDIEKDSEALIKTLLEQWIKKMVSQNAGNFTNKMTSVFASSFKVDERKIAGAFKLKMDEDELARLFTAMLSTTKTKTAKSNLISLGYQDKEEPTYISFYFNSFEGKENFISFLETYNAKMADEEDKIINYSDTTGILMESVKIIVNAVTYVLIAFISISLVVSSIMIGIITYISVYERTKEIGILRAIGASKRNISSIFNAETFIIGLLSGLFGIGVTLIAIPIINAILHAFTGDIPLNATFYFSNAILLIVLSIILTLIGGIIPARAASKKDPVIALRTE